MIPPSEWPPSGRPPSGAPPSGLPASGDPGSGRASPPSVRVVSRMESLALSPDGPHVTAHATTARATPAVATLFERPQLMLSPPAYTRRAEGVNGTTKSKPPAGADCSCLRRASRCLQQGHRPAHGYSMWPKILAKRIGIDYPIILAPMAGGPSTPELVASVCEAGGLGSIGAGYLAAAAVRARIRGIRALTDRPFA